MTWARRYARIDRSHLLVLLTLLLVAFVPRFLTANRAIWFDERFTLMNTTSIHQAIEHCIKDVHPPLYFVLVTLWRMALPSTEFSLRLLSLIFGMLSVVGIFLVARSIAGWRAGVAASLVAALAPDQWLYSTELRPYPLLLAFSAFATWALLRLLSTGRGRYFIVFTASTILNLYSHYFAGFLLVVQALVFLVAVVRNWMTGAWTVAHRNRQILLGVLALVAVAVAYIPWFGVLRRIVTQSIFEGQVVGVGEHLGRGATPALFWNTLHGSLGGAALPFSLQVICVGWSLRARRFQEASVLFICSWAVPFLMLIAWRPAHFIAPKYFLFTYPLTVAVVGAGIAAAAKSLTAWGGSATLAFGVLALAVSASPLLPGQHAPYTFSQTDWRDVVKGLDDEVAEGGRISFLDDSKSYAMVLHYADADFFKRHPLIFWRSGAGEAGETPFESGPGGSADVWILHSGTRAVDLLSGFSGELKLLKTWAIYPTSVSLYRWTPATQTAPPD